MALPSSIPANKDSLCCASPKPKSQRQNEPNSSRDDADSQKASPSPRLKQARLTWRSTRLTFSLTANPAESRRSSSPKTLSRRVKHPNPRWGKEEQHACQKSYQEGRDLCWYREAGRNQE